MRRFSVAPRWFESLADPHRKLACLHVVALLLAEVPGDGRRPGPGRTEAEELLQWVTQQRLLGFGLVAEFGEVCMRCTTTLGVCVFCTGQYNMRCLFWVLLAVACQTTSWHWSASERFTRATRHSPGIGLLVARHGSTSRAEPQSGWVPPRSPSPLRFLREFDKADGDAASTAQLLNKFEETFRRLFVQGYILMPAKEAHPHGGALLDAPQDGDEDMPDAPVLAATAPERRLRRQAPSL